MRDLIFATTLFLEAGLVFAALIAAKKRQGVEHSDTETLGLLCASIAGAGLGLALPGEGDDWGVFLFLYFAVAMPFLASTSMRVLRPSAHWSVPLLISFIGAMLGGATAQP